MTKKQASDARYSPAGIAKGKPFTPDEKTKALLSEAAQLGGEMARANTFADHRAAGRRPNSASERATGLTPSQRTWLVERIDSERAEREAVRKFSLSQAFDNPKVWLISIAYVGTNGASYGVAFFLPLIVKGLGVSTNMIGVVAAPPFLVALIAMNYWGWHSDKIGARKWHADGACLLCAVGLANCTLIDVGHPAITMVAPRFSRRL
jgi:hypothetical protein